MKSSPVIFIGLKQYDNLGIGYMSSILRENCFQTRIIDLNNSRSSTLRIIKNLNPNLVGFSVIYLHNLKKFIDLIDFLRKEGVNCHFTAGGHYASLRCSELFERIPSLDSVVRFEGEYTMLELAKCISDGSDWRYINGLVFRHKNKIISNKPRPFEKDLDKFPFPVRSPLITYAFWKKCATLIAGRGCLHNCSFCNTRKFYSQIPGEVKRIRRPDMVVKEMEMLYNRRNCEIFLFLDDDFPMHYDDGEDWILRFCNQLEKTGLKGKILWKINCRPDEVDEIRFASMKKHGLFSVFLGIEDGTESGLKKMGKNITASTIIKTINILKKLKIRIDYGFLLFQPNTTFKSLNENLSFLRIIFGDGYSPLTWLKMMPFYETQIEKELLSEKRLKVKHDMTDYDFLEDSMNHYYSYISDCYNDWLRAADGMENTAGWALNYISVYIYYFDVQAYARSQIRKVRKIVSDSNTFLLDSMQVLSVYFENRKHETDDSKFLESYKQHIRVHHNLFVARIRITIANLISCSQEQQIRGYMNRIYHIA
jgi:anaerobic magnesium-protoporphyrin IX monomethyl ester cyclase